jgi:serine kinase of HPr protein (carbohydrate metabolism regulator)
MPEDPDSKTIHASCVAIDGHAILICGVSGAGKSDLALRLLDRGAALISDDYTILKRQGAGLSASAPANIAGFIEVRGVGIVEWPCIAEAPVVLGIRLDVPPERLPPDPPPNRTILGIAVPFLAIDGLHASAAIKVELAVRGIVDAAHKMQEGS